MAELTMRGTGNIDQVFSYLDQAVVSHATTCQAVGTHGAAFGDARIILRVYEKYYMRNSSRASLTVLMTAQNNVVDVKIVSSGGSGSAIMKFSWGAEEEFVGVAEGALQQIGFVRL